MALLVQREDAQLSCRSTWARAMRLLLVEDDAMIGASVRAGLRQDGYVVDWVQDGAAAEAALAAEPAYALVLLDLGLPRKDGFARPRAPARERQSRARAGHHRARRGGRPRAGPRSRRRRLSREAFEPGRARGAHPRGAAPARRARRAGHRARRLHARPERAQGDLSAAATVARLGARVRAARGAARPAGHGALARAARGAPVRLGRGGGEQLDRGARAQPAQEARRAAPIRTRARRRLRDRRSRAAACRSGEHSS